MMPFPKIHDTYAARVVFGTVVLTWVVLVGLDAVLALVDQFGSVGQGNYASCRRSPTSCTRCPGAPTRCFRQLR